MVAPRVKMVKMSDTGYFGPEHHQQAGTRAMVDITPSPPNRLRRRTLMAGVAAPLLLPTRAAHAQAALASMTSDLLEATKKEGSVTFYTSDEEVMATQLAKAFEAAHPGIRVAMVRATAETLLKRIGDDQNAGQVQADVITTNDVRSLILFRRSGWLVPYIPEPVRRWTEAARDPAGFYAIQNGTLIVIGYNTRRVPTDQAPKGYEDLLTRRWHAKLVKVHPRESGIALTAAFLLNRELGWIFWERLSQQSVLHVGTEAEAPAKLASGERLAMVDATEQAALRLRASGAPIEIVHAKEGTPLVPSGTAMFKEAPHPNAARLFVEWLMGREAQQLVVNAGARSYHPDIREAADRAPIAALKLWTADPILLAVESELIKQIYDRFFPH